MEGLSSCADVDSDYGLIQHSERGVGIAAHSGC